MRSTLIRQFLDDRGYKTRSFRGWRLDSIDRCLDFCAKVPGYVTVEWSQSERRDDSGRFLRLWDSEADCKRAWARNNVEKARANSIVQWRKQDQVMRSEYSEFVPIFSSIYKDVAVMGYDRFRRSFIKLWRQDRALCLARVHAVQLSFRSQKLFFGDPLINKGEGAACGRGKATPGDGAKRNEGVQPPDHSVRCEVQQ
jgi:hypothetical protein